MYVQSAYLLTDAETVQREYAPLEAIKDNYEKMVVSLDEVQLPQNKGIKHVQAWLLHHAL